MIIVSNIKTVDKIILSVDLDHTVCAKLQIIADKHGPELELANIALIDGLGYKIKSSSWLLN